MNFLLSWQGMALVLPLLATLMGHLIQSTKANLSEQLLDPQDRHELRQSLLNTNPVHAYRTAVDLYFLKPVERLFGKAWSWQSFFQCFNIALIYPTVLVVIAWAAGAECSFGHNACPIPIDIPEGPQRWFRGGLILICLIIGFAAGFFLTRYESKISKNVLSITPVSQSNIDDPESTSRFFTHILVLYLGFLLISKGLPALLVNPAFSHVSGTVAAVLAGTVICVTVGMATADRGLWWLPLAAALSLIVGQLLLGNHGGAIVIIVISMALPLINGFIDWLSLGLTRKLLTIGITSQSRRGLGAVAMISGRIVVDIATALFTMVLLAAATAIIIEAFNKWIVVGRFGRDPVDLWYLIDVARYDPLSIGLLTTFMLATTLLPTIAHLVAGLAGIGFALSPRAKQAANLIPKEPDIHFSAAARQNVTRILLWRLIWVFPAIVFTLLMLAGILTFLSFTVEPIGLMLADTAYCATAWSHGICPAPDNLPFPKLTPFSIHE